MRERLIGWAVLAAVFVASWCLIVEHDTPWYLACGDLILRTRSLPAHDPFSFTSSVPWLNHEWLSEVLLALVYRVGGWKLLSLACAASVAAVLFIAASRRLLDAPLIWVFLLVILRETFAPRAGLFADLAFVSTLALVISDDDDAPQLWWCVPIQLLWTQLHGGNPLGVVLLALRFVTGPSRKRALVTVACALATCAGPYGIHVHEHFAGAHDALPMIREWQSLREPLAAGSISAWLSVTMIAAAFIATIAFVRRDARSRFAFVAVAVFGIAALRWSRFVTEASIVAAVALAPPVARLARARVVSLVAVALAIALAARGPRTPGLGLDERGFPIGAVAWLRANHPTGPMFNSYNFGGYLLWAWPEQRVFIDGRAFTVYDAAFLSSLPALYANPSRFESLVTRYDLHLAVLQRTGRGAAFDEWLSSQASWARVYRDPLADVFVRAR